MNANVTASILIAAALLAGCTPINNSVRNAADNEFRDIRSGESTREDIERLLGKPENRTAFHRLGEEVWDYRYATTWHMLLSVHFAADTGKVKYYTDTPDPAFHYNAWGIN